MATTAKRPKTTATPPTAPKGRQPKRPGMAQPPTPAPEPTPTQPRCLVPGCPRHVVRRGLCHPCAAEAGALVRAGLTSWEALEAASRARPLARETPKGDLPHRKAWLLGQWAPGDPWPPPPVEGEAGPAGGQAEPGGDAPATKEAAHG